jgi:hypothetical protein
VSFLSFNCSWNTERKTLVLLWFELEDVIQIQIYTKPYKNNYGKREKARTVVDFRKKGQQKNPEGSIIGQPYKGEWVSGPLFN